MPFARSLPDVAKARQADLATQAEADGYGDPGLPCFDSPGTNQGIGFHLVNGDLLNDGGSLSRTHPEALVYEMHSERSSWSRSSTSC